MHFFVQIFNELTGWMRKIVPSLHWVMLIWDCELALSEWSVCVTCPGCILCFCPCCTVDKHHLTSQLSSCLCLLVSRSTTSKKQSWSWQQPRSCALRDFSDRSRTCPKQTKEVRGSTVPTHMPHLLSIQISVLCNSMIHWEDVYQRLVLRCVG